MNLGYRFGMVLIIANPYGSGPLQRSATRYPYGTSAFSPFRLKAPLVQILSPESWQFDDRDSLFGKRSQVILGCSAVD